jgi:ABC-type phosphate transport system substrate-binding protein
VPVFELGLRGLSAFGLVTSGPATAVAQKDRAQGTFPQQQLSGDISMIALRTGLIAAVAVVVAGAAQAQSNTTNTSGAAIQLNAGGASLPAPTYRQLFNCFGLPTDTTTALPAGCSARVRTDVSINFGSVGSGAGQRAFYTHARDQLGSGQPAGAMAFGASDAALSQAQINVYNATTTSAAGVSPLASGQVLEAPGVTPTAASHFANPNASYGPMIELPAMGVAVTIAYAPIYKQIRNAKNGNVTNYVFNVQNLRGGGGLRLDAATYCAIFSGEITDWNDSRITALNVNPTTGQAVSLRAANDPTPLASWSVPIKVAVRDDNSGTTALFTRHLRAKCAQFQTATVLATTTAGNLSAGFSQAIPGINTGTSVTGTTAGTCAAATNSIFPGSWMRGRGNEGVTVCVGGNSPMLVSDSTKKVAETRINGVIGYLSTDFVLPYVTAANPAYAQYGVNTANLQNEAGQWISPLPTSTQASLGALLPPTTATAKASPFNWVADPSGAVAGTAGIIPASVTAGYPIVGTTNMLVYTCYASNTVRSALVNSTVGATEGYLNWFYRSPTAVTNIIKAGGFAVLPTTTRSAIVSTFLTGTTSALRVRTGPVAGLCSTGA